MDERQIDKLLTRISTGDNEAFEELYEKTKRGVFSFVYSYLDNYASTEDVMQTVYLKIKLNIDKYKQGTNGRAWMLQIAKNLALNELKRRKNAEYNDGLISSEPTVALSGEVTDTMRRTLTVEERQIVILHVLWGYKHREIAKELGVPTGTVTSKYKRSVSKMQAALKEV
ncbi:MAG: RNA polymerase sigma factor [Clostridia bacterium]|nr:RNA polymerase sigma factor [Clostridia bacterium]